MRDFFFTNVSILSIRKDIKRLFEFLLEINLLPQILPPTLFLWASPRAHICRLVILFPQKCVSFSFLEWEQLLDLLKSTADMSTHVFCAYFFFYFGIAQISLLHINEIKQIFTIPTIFLEFSILIV
jgi:hypothetical protein